MADATELDARSIVTTRLIDAPRDLVFEAFTDPKHLSQWWGPDGFTTTTSRFEFRPGGVWRFVMHGPDGRDWQNRVQFEEIVPPERIAIWHDDGKDNPEIRFHNTITLEDTGGKTQLTMRGVFATAQERERVARENGAVEGGQQTVARLAAYVAQLARKKG